MTYQDFILRWNQEVLPNKPSYMRKGQWFMCYLAEEWLEEYMRITGNPLLDCFYIDSKLPDTKIHLEVNWSKYPN